MNFSFFFPYELLPWQWVAWIALGLCIGMVKAGFSGLSAVIIPVIALIFGARESTGLLLPLFCFADILAVLYYRRYAQWNYIARLLPWSLAGMGLALLIVHLMPVYAFKYLMALCILVSLMIMIWNEYRGASRNPPNALWFQAAVGAAGGFATLAGNVAGPIMAVFLLSMRLPKNSFVGTSALYFMIINYCKLPILIFVWKTITVETLLFNVTLIPVIISGIALGFFLVKKTNETLYRKIIILLTFVSTVLLFL